MRPAANQTNSPVWQDPVYGYYEQHGKMRFKPNEEYGISEAEKQAVLHRYRIKEILKKEYLRREYDPHHFNYKHAIVVRLVLLHPFFNNCLAQMCPAMFRWYAMDRTHAETFRYTPRSIFLVMAVGGIVVVYVVKALFQIKVRCALCIVEFTHICRATVTENASLASGCGGIG